MAGMKSLQLPTFDPAGTPLEAENFVRLVNSFAKQHKLKEDQAAEAAIFSFRGHAVNWFYVKEQEDVEGLHVWRAAAGEDQANCLRALLLAEYGSVLSDAMLAKKVAECRQRSDETVAQFYHRAASLVYNSYEGTPRITEGEKAAFRLATNKTITNVFLNGMKPHLNQITVTTAKKPDGDDPSPQEYLAAAKLAEKTLQDNGFASKQQAAINAMEGAAAAASGPSSPATPVDELRGVIDEFRSFMRRGNGNGNGNGNNGQRHRNGGRSNNSGNKNKDMSKVQCRRCKKMGHYAATCPAPTPVDAITSANAAAPAAAAAAGNGNIEEMPSTAADVLESMWYQGFC